MIKVYNDNPQVPKWKEEFKGQQIVIEYGKPIEMEFFEANEFKSQFYPFKYMADDTTQDPKTMKMIRLEKIDLNEINKEVEKTIGFTCNACKKTFDNVKLLTNHSESEHAELIVVDERLEEELKELKKAEPPKKRGRPNKVETVQATE